eukprot:CAMPEP_0177629820 /NCGR_PEP_ID=MMETSP0447-20121125/871_1 /TAXON_ID=0 /ORGANISM="Stygamoeba regulata, Strain BSH-02190019" /LENGTH=611 /DNA_ID=CAMNT_0019131165 /DNA_START=70 /DNA_END=1905 /DNA_ORIENTATION=-
MSGDDAAALFADLQAQVELLSSGTVTPNSFSPEALDAFARQDAPAAAGADQPQAAGAGLLTARELELLRLVQDGGGGQDVPAAHNFAPSAAYVSASHASPAEVRAQHSGTVALPGLAVPRALDILPPQDGPVPSDSSGTMAHASHSVQHLPPELQAVHMMQQQQQQQLQQQQQQSHVLVSHDARLSAHESGAEAATRHAIGELDLMRGRLRDITSSFEHMRGVGGDQINQQVPHSSQEELMILFKICNLEVDKIQLMIQGYQEQIERVLASNSTLLSENADLKRFKEDFLNERRSMLKKVGDKISSNRKGIKVNSERERRHMERDLLNAKDQLRDEIALRSELEVSIAAIKRDNDRLRRLAGERGGPVPETEDLDKPSSGKVASTENRFLPPSTPKTSVPTTSVANLLDGISVVQQRQLAPTVSSADEAARASSAQSQSRSQGGESTSLADPLKPKASIADVRPAEVFGLVALAEEAREINPERGFQTPTTFEDQFAALAKEGRMMVMCGKEMKGKPAAERDWQGAAYRLANILSTLIAISDLLHAKEFNDDNSKLLTDAMAFAKDGMKFVQAAKNPRTEFDFEGILPRFADFRPSMMTVIATIKQVKPKL